MSTEKIVNMKRINIFIIVSLLVVIGHAQETQTERAAFGIAFQGEGSLTQMEMSKKYTTMKISDTVQTKFVGVVKEVCQAKGCWMKVALDDGEVAMVRFKDYGFFMPKDIAGKEVVVNGLAFVEEMSVDDQRHYAEDAGKSVDEIAKINQPKRTLGFEADGVLLKD